MGQPIFVLADNLSVASVDWPLIYLKRNESAVSGESIIIEDIQFLEQLKRFQTQKSEKNLKTLLFDVSVFEIFSSLNSHEYEYFLSN